MNAHVPSADLALKFIMRKSYEATEAAGGFRVKPRVKTAYDIALEKQKTLKDAKLSS